MPYIIMIRGNSTPAEDAAITTAFNNALTTLRAASSRKVDCGGTIIGGKKMTGDEVGNPTVRQGDVF